MKMIFLSKQGYLLRIVSSLLQILIFSPISLLLSLIVSSVIFEFFYINTLSVFNAVFIFINLLWLLRNSFVRVTNDKVLLYDFIGKRKTIELDGISSLKIIDYKELRNIVFSHSGNNPLISNSFAFLLPIGKFIMFKNKFGRDVIIGVWNYKRLYEFLICNNSDSTVSEIEESNNYKKSNEVFTGEKFIFFVRMPLKNHIITYLKHLPETVLIPLIFLSFIFFSLNRIGIKINPFIFALIFFISSSIAYYFIIRIIVDTESDTLRLKLFNDNNKNIIKIDNINNLEYVNSASEFVAENNSKFIICTPYHNKKGSNLISFETSKNICVILSVNKPDKLYNILKKYNKQ